MDITLKLIDEIASPETVARGRSYFHNGRVRLESVSETTVTARVDGSDIYLVELHHDERGFDASCSCPFQSGGKCKHVVATMLAVLYRSVEVNYIPKDAEQKKRDEQRTSWARDISTLLPRFETASPSSTSDGEWRPAYSLKISKQHRTLVPIKLKISTDGTIEGRTVLRRADISNDPHFDTFDRILLEKILPELSTIVPSTAEDGEALQRNGRSSNDTLMSDMLRLLVNKELFLARQTNYTFRRLHVSSDPARVRLGLSEAPDGGISVEPELEWGGRIFPLPFDVVLLSTGTPWILFDNNVVCVDDISPADFLNLVRTNHRLVVPERDRDEFMDEVLPLLVKRFKVRSELPSLLAIDAAPKPRLYLSESNEKLSVELRFLYDTVEIPEMASTRRDSVASDLVPNGTSFAYVHRRPDDEAALIKRVRDTSLVPYVRNDGSKHYLPLGNPLDWLLQELPRLQDEGFEIFGQENLRRHRVRNGRPRIVLRISSGVDWFDLNVDVKFEGSTVSFRELVEAVRRDEQYVRLGDGTVGVLPDQWVKRFRRALAVGAADTESIRLARTHLGLLSDMSSEADEFESDAQFEEMRIRLKSFKTIEKQKLPKKFNGELRPYQKAGYDWLNFLREFGVGGILADDMGLGKTVQALVVLQNIYENGATQPSLVVVPTSPLFNWQKEIERFTPQLKTLVYAGLDRKEHLRSFGDYHIILTTYGILRRDIEDLRQMEFLYVILDESQHIKNHVSINAQAARALRAKHRLALSGTPVENNLNELWSQFAFLNPGMLGSERAFMENFAKPIERFGDEAASQALRELIYPFILRRTKEIVATELPPKVESTIYCDMDEDQKRAYEFWRQYYREIVLKSIDTLGLHRSKIKVLEGLMRLRQVCCHPKLIDETYQGTAGKFEMLTEMLEDILAEGHKVLVFSQFVKMLSVLRSYCDKENIAYEYLDGSTRNRRERVERFQGDENVKLFLISLRAGGTGVNLTAADYVIHYDPWWNPAVEMQATDRTHRIGQTKQVFAYKLITRESVEEKILALQEKKQALVKSIITTDSGFMKSLTKEDVEALFS